MTAQPRMLAPTQIEAHITRLTAVREGLKKFSDDDGRAAECVRILEVAIKTLESEPFSPNENMEPFSGEVEETEDVFPPEGHSTCAKCVEEVDDTSNLAMNGVLVGGDAAVAHTDAEVETVAPDSESEPETAESHSASTLTEVERPDIAHNIVHDEQDDMSDHDWQTHTHEGYDYTVTPHEHSVSEDVVDGRSDSSPDPLPTAPGE